MNKPAFYRRAIQLMETPRAPRLFIREPGPDLSALRVAVISDALRDRNGVDAYYRDLVSHLRTRVAAAELLSPDTVGEHRLTWCSMPLPGDRTQKIYYPHPRRLYRRLRAIAPHVVVAATPGPFGLSGVLAKRWLDAGLVAGFHTHLERLAELYWNDAVIGINRRCLTACNRILLRRAERVVVNSHDMIAVARALGAAGVELVGTPLPEGFINTPVSAFDTRLQRVLYAGRLSPEKNLHQVIEAAQRLPHIRFSIAGQGPLDEQITAHAAALANLRYLGWLPREQLMSALDRADLLVLPSRIEAFGTVALEAMARGKLALVSPQCGIVQWRKFGECVFRVRPDEHLADAISRIASLPPANRARAAAMGPLKARELHERTLDQWLSLLQAVASRAPISATASRSVI